MMQYILKLILVMHNMCYRYAASIAIRLEGKHPKHRIMRYKEWFRDNLHDDDVVLDIGCNTGSMAMLMAEKVEYVYGVEINKDLIDVAKRNNDRENVEFVLADATAMDYKKLRSISVVTMSNVLEHIDNRKDFLRSIIENVKWRNAENKKLLIRVPVIDRDWITLYKKELGVEWRLDPTHYIEYTKKGFLEELDSVGVYVEELDIRFGEIYAVCYFR